MKQLYFMKSIKLRYRRTYKYENIYSCVTTNSLHRIFILTLFLLEVIVN